MRKRTEKAASKLEKNSGTVKGGRAVRANAAVKMAETSVPAKAASRPAALVTPGREIPIAISTGKSRKRKPVRRMRSTGELRIPPILLEGDPPSVTEAGGPGTKYTLTAERVSETRRSTGGGELPASYGTGRLFLAARDPHWLYASWDITRERQQEFNARSRDGRLIIRVFADGELAPVISEIHLHPESRDWFINVPRAATRYSAELGYVAKNGEWQSVSRSTSTFTPPDSPSPEAKADFATIPPEISFQQVVKAVQKFAVANEPLLEAVARANEAARKGEPEQVSAPAQGGELPSRGGGKETAPTVHSKTEKAEPRRDEPVNLPVRIEPGRPLSSSQRNALARLINLDGKRRVWMGSLEITELVRRQLQEEIASISAAALGESRARGAQPLGAINAESSRMPGVPSRSRKFWFKVNAELVIYGATEPNARVTIAEREVKLRPDGSFTFRFSLPDGRYALPAIALSPDGADAREARLEFSRATEYRGEVQAHSQEARLRPPQPEHIG